MSSTSGLDPTIDNVHILAKYNAKRVVISYAVSFLGAYLATSLCEQLRASYMVGKGRALRDFKWFILMGVSLGGIGIWCMHFIGMSSVSLSIRTVDNTTSEFIETSIDIYFNNLISIVSLVVVIFMTTVGVMVSANDPLFMKTKGEILEMFIQDTSALSMTEVRKMRNSRLFVLITTKNLGYLVCGGVIAGSGVSVMHYIGMEAMMFHGTIEWDPVLVIVSVLIAILAATAAFWILFRLLSIFPSREFLRLVSSLIMGIAVCGMHYTGMMAASFVYESDNYQDHNELHSSHMNKEDAYLPVIAAAIIAIVMITIVLLADLRGIVHRYNLQVRRNLILNYDSGMLSSESNTINSNNGGNNSTSGGHSVPNPHSRAAYLQQHHHYHPHRKQQLLLRQQRSGIATSIPGFSGLKVFPSFNTVSTATETSNRKDSTHQSTIRSTDMPTVTMATVSSTSSSALATGQGNGPSPRLAVLHMKPTLIPDSPQDKYASMNNVGDDDEFYLENSIRTV